MTSLSRMGLCRSAPQIDDKDGFMASLEFYAAEQDVAEVAAFLLQNGFHVYHDQPPVGQEIEVLASVDSFMDAYRATMTTGRTNPLMLVMLWHPETKGRVVFERVRLDAKLYPGADQFRCFVRGWGLIELQLSGVSNNVLRYSHTGHQSEARATVWSPAYDLGTVDEWDWQAVAKNWRALAYHIRSRLGIAKIGSAVVLPHAFQLSQSGISFQPRGVAGLESMVLIEKRARRRQG